MKPQVDKQTYDTLGNVAAECAGCELLCSQACEVLQEIAPTAPGDVARQVLGGQVDEDIRRFLLRCSLCGLCVNSCPKSLDIPQMVIAARRVMVDTGMTDTEVYRIMWVDHDWNAITIFRDTYQLNFDNLIKEKCYTLFMPGCSLANEAPQLVYTTIDWLDEQGGDKAGVILMCCGMPLLEMGLTERAKRYERSFWQKVKETGARRVVVACPNCFHHLIASELKKDIEVVSMLELMAKSGLRVPSAKGKKITIHDSCPSRYGEMGKWARQLLGDYEITEMEHHGKNSLCCGSGGVVSMVDKELHDKRSKRRLEEFKNTGADICATYCMACWHTLSQKAVQGDVRFILELVFDQFIDHAEYQNKLQAMWEGEWGVYNDFRLRNSQMLDECRKEK